MNKFILWGYLLSGFGGLLFFLKDSLWWHLFILCLVSLCWGYLSRQGRGSGKVKSKGDAKQMVSGKGHSFSPALGANNAEKNAVPMSRALVARFDEEYLGIQSDLQQMSGLLHDANAQLTTDFKALENDTRGQLHLIEGLAAETTENREDTYTSVNFEMFIDKTEGLLGDFVESVVHTSKNSMKLVEKLEDISEAITAILGDVEGVDLIAEQTKVLAINATIEAARAGEAGKGFAVVASEVRLLVNRSKRFGEHITERVREIQVALQKAEISTNEIASRDLIFALLAKKDTGDMMDKITKLNNKMLKSMESIKEINANIKSHVGNAVTVLQFEDLSTQLIGKVSSRLENIKQILSGMRGDLPEEAVSREIQKKLPSVIQGDMEAGGVELF